MKKFLCSNGFKVVLVLLLTMAVFCGALLLATYTAEIVVSANAEAVAPLSIGGTFDQVVNSQDGLSFEDSTSTISTTEKTEYDLYTSFLGGVWWPDVSFNSGDTYFVRFTYYNVNRSTGTFEVDYTESTPVIHSYNLSTSVYSKEVSFFLYPTTRPTLFRFVFTGLTVPVGISCFEIINISNLDYYYDSSIYNTAYTIQDLTSFSYYFGSGYHRYGFDIFASSAKYYSFDSYYDDGYTRGYDVGTEVGYSDGYSTGYTDGVLANTGVTYVCSVSDWTDGPNSFVADQFVGGLYVPSINGSHYVSSTDSYRTALNIGYADIFPDYSYDQLRNGTITGYLPSYYSSYLQYSNDASNVSPISNSYIIDFATTSMVFGNTGTSYYIDLIYSVLDNNNNSHPLLVFRLYEHQTALTISAVDYAYSSSPDYPITWHTLNVKPSASVNPYKVVFTLQFNTVNGYSSGYVDGIQFADSRVNDGSASYSAGYNYGVESVGNFTFPSVIAAAIDVPVQTARNLLNFDFFGTNLNAFVLSLLSFGIVVAVVKLLLGR